MNGSLKIARLVSLFALTAGQAETEPPVSREPVKPAAASPKADVRTSPPDWLGDSKWYYVVLPRFRNGDPANDPEGTLPWTAKWQSSDASVGTDPPKAVHERRYGGDLRGLRSKLPYLKSLGVNTLCLSPVFQAESEHKFYVSDWRHIDDSLGVKNSLEKITGETEDPRTWKFTESDRAFLDFVKVAHEQGFRVVVHVMFERVGEDFWAWHDGGRTGKHRDWVGKHSEDVSAVVDIVPRSGYVDLRLTDGGLAPGVERHLLAIAKRWMDPNGDGNPSDGIDGWVHSSKRIPKGLWKRWTQHVRKLNRDAMTARYVRDAEGDAWRRSRFDAMFNLDGGTAVLQLFDPCGPEPNEAQKPLLTLSRHFARLEALQTGQEPPPSLSVNPLSGSVSGRARKVLGVLKSSGGDETNAKAGDLNVRWKLATILQHFLPGVPMTYYGDEVGMAGPRGESARAPMWWDDLPGKQTKASGYRSDFASLIQWLHLRRDVDEPLRRGMFRTLITNERKRVLAAARTMPGKEVVLVMNYGGTKQKVMVPVGKPGEIVGLFTPHITPSASARKPRTAPGEIPPLRMGGSKQQVSFEGLVRVWINPMSVRFILRQDR